MKKSPRKRVRGTGQDHGTATTSVTNVSIVTEVTMKMTTDVTGKGQEAETENGTEVVAGSDHVDLEAEIGRGVRDPVAGIGTIVADKEEVLTSNELLQPNLKPDRCTMGRSRTLLASVASSPLKDFGEKLKGSFIFRSSERKEE